MRVKIPKSSSTFGRLLTSDLNSATYYHVDRTSGDTILETVADVGEITDHTIAGFNNYRERAPWRTKGMGLNKVAVLPMEIWLRLRKEGRDNPKDMGKFLQDKDNAVFRARTGSF